MSPSGRPITFVEPCMMWSPVNSVRSSLSRCWWFEAWPGCRAVRWNSVASITAVAQRPVEADLALPRARKPGSRQAELLQADGAEVVLVGVGRQDPADAVAAPGDGVEVGGFTGTGVDHMISSMPTR